MKILHVVNDANTGGAQTLIESLAILKRPDIEVHLFVLMGKGSLSNRLEQAVSSVTYGSMSRKSVDIFGPILTLRRLVKSLQIDVLHSHLLQSDLLCLLARTNVPHVSTVHTSGAHESNRVSRGISRVVALMSRRFDEVVACSPSAASWAQRMKYRGQGNIQMIHNGSQVPARLVLLDKQPSFVCLSRWHPMKDHWTLLRAFAIFARKRSEWRLVCAGQNMDSDNADLVAMIRELGIESSVILKGPVQDVRTLMAESRALVISSSHGEALPMAGIEALASGIPVVTTDVGDCASLAVRADYLVPPSSPSELAHALERVASIAPSDYEEAQERAWRLARRLFDAEDTAKSYENIYDNLSR